MKTTNPGAIALVGIISFVDQASAQSSQPEEIYIVRFVRKTVRRQPGSAARKGLVEIR